MNADKFILLLLNLVLLIVGTGIAWFLDFPAQPLNFGFNSIIASMLLVFGFFVLSIAFFGLLTPFLFLYFGFIYSSTVFSNPFGFLLLTVSLTMGSHYGSILAQALNRDMNGIDPLEDYSHKILTGLVLALIMAAVSGYVFDLQIKIAIIETIREIL